MTHALKKHKLVTGKKADKAEKTLIRNGLEELWAAGSIFDDQSATIKERDVKATMELASKTPPAGMPGYTAQYRPSLWFNRIDDDIGFWVGRELASRQEPFRNTGTSLTTRSAKELREIILSDIDRYRNCSPGIAATVNQNLAMTFGPFASDPQHSWFRRKKL